MIREKKGVMACARAVVSLTHIDTDDVVPVSSLKCFSKYLLEGR